MNKSSSSNDSFDQSIAAQHAVFQSAFSGPHGQAFRVTHDTRDPLTRYVRDRRMRHALTRLGTTELPAFSEMTALVVCGGAGGEATFLRRSGFRKVVNSDFSSEAVARAQERDPEVESLVINAQDMDLPDDAFDLVLVQDGLHHLPRPACGLNEMLRVAKRAVIVLEPHCGIVAQLFGTSWERHGQTTNYVFRWNSWLFRQVAHSQFAQHPCEIVCMRIWDHSGLVYKLSRLPHSRIVEPLIAKLIYSLLAPLNFMGNSFIGLAIKS